MGYREEAGALERRRGRLWLEVRDLEQRWTPTFWAEVAPGEKIAPPAETSDARDADVERELARLTARLDELERLERRREPLLRAWSEPAPLPASRECVRLDALARGERARGVLGDAYAGREPFADEVALGIATRLRRAAAELPMQLFLEGSSGRLGDRVRVLLAMPRGAPKLDVRVEGLLDDLRKTFGALREIELDDPRFDPVFLVRGDEEAARAVLAPAVRQALVRLGQYDRPMLVLGPGLASLSGLTMFAATQLRPEVYAGALATILHAAARAPIRPLRAPGAP